MPNVEEPVSIAFDLEPSRVAKLRKSFPEPSKVETVASALAKMMTNEIINLLAGEKRYLSLSHQYVEWLRRFIHALLPNEECSYEKLYNRFNFPPGTAQSVGRVLRDRQNTSLHQRALLELHTNTTTDIQEYDKLPTAEKPSAKQRSMRLSIREFNLLQVAVDRLVETDELIEYPKITSRSKQFVVIVFDVDHMRKVLENTNNYQNMGRQ